LAGCEALREATRGCRLVLLAATEVEAEPLLAALISPQQAHFATKTVSIGELRGTYTSESDGRAGRADPSDLRTVVAVSGCDKVNAALVVTSLLQAMSPAPELVLQVGVAGGFPPQGAGRGAVPGDLVIATQEAYSDCGSSSPEGWISAGDLGLPIAQVDGVELGGVFPLERRLVEWAAGVLAAEAFTVVMGACVTSSTVTGTDRGAKLMAERWGPLAESMEGAAAAHVCALYGVPFLELRGISNMVGDRDRSTWLIDQAAETAGRAALVLAAALARRAEA
jgi:futalosine hydrolase